MTAFLNSLNDFLWGLPFLLFVLLVGLYFTVRGGFFTVTKFGHVMKYTMGSLRSKEANEKKSGQVSPFEAVCIAIGGSVGAANISGVATAIVTGGPGAVFWLWVWAFFGMMVKLVETTLGCYYRSKDEKGNFYGGPMYFMEKGIGREMGLKVGFYLAALFAFCFVIQFIQGSQAYTISEVLNKTFGVNMIVVTLLYTAFIYYIIWKGTPRIANFATKAVPFMCVIFVLGGIILIIANIQNLPHTISAIFHDAFTGSAAVGGFLGATVIKAMNMGIARSISSNEAGQGSSPLIHGSANTVHPVRQGLWGSFEVFVDTLVVCTVTALSVLCTGAWETGVTGASLTILAYESLYGQLGAIYIGIMVILFGLTTTAGWFVYYVTVISYALRNNPRVRDKVIFLFKIIFPLMNVIIVSYIVASGHDAELFWTIVGIVTAPAVFFNLIALILLRKKFFTLLKDYKARYMNVGKVDPDFYVFYEDDPAVAEEEEAIRHKLLEKEKGIAIDE